MTDESTTESTATDESLLNGGAGGDDGGQKDDKENSSAKDGGTESGDSKTEPQGDKKPDGEGADSDEKKDGESKAPDSYEDFEVPEGLTLDQSKLDKALPIFKEANLSQEQAQKVVDIYADMVSSEAKASSDAFSKQMEDWVAEVRADKEIGGDKFDENVAIANRALKSFGDDAAIEALQTTGLGNHPALVRMFYKIGLTVKEDDPGGEGRNATGERDPASILYPNSN